MDEVVEVDGVDKELRQRASMNKVRQLENREQLAEATERYFEQLTVHTLAAENALAEEIMSAAKGINFDKEI